MYIKKFIQNMMKLTFNQVFILRNKIIIIIIHNIEICLLEKLELLFKQVLS